MSKCKRFFWLLPLSFCLLFMPGDGRTDNENQHAAGAAVTDKVPPANKSVLPAESEAVVKKQPPAAKRTTKTDRRPEPEIILPLEANDDDKREAQQDIMERALDLLNSSQENWVKGDIENALDVLDQAYALLLDTNGDTDISRQKDDLRLLISKKILAIYTSKHTATNGKRSAIPAVMNAEVEREIHSFQTIERDFFIQAYQRSLFFRPIVLTALKKAGLPEELSWLPLVESGFKIRALSSARALGLWQFIPSTGYKYGLNRDEWIDERMDVEKSTQAAIGYLKDLHDMFGDWLTVLAGYNCGEGKVLRVISGQHINYLDRFWDLYNQLPNETARYVPRFLATLEIIKDPRKYDMDLDGPQDKQSIYVYDTVTTVKCMNLQDIASRIDVSEDLLCTMNAELRHKKTPDKEYGLKIPPEASKRFIMVMDEIPQAERPRSPESRRLALIRHKVKAGETLASIANRYETTVGAIRKYNKSLRNSNAKAGQNLSIPISSSRSARTTQEKESAGKKTFVADEKFKYKIKKGDTLSSLSRNFNISVSEIKNINRINGDVLKVGQILKFDNKARVGEQLPKTESLRKAQAKEDNNDKMAAKTGREQNKYVVKKGDNLNKIAQQNGSNIDQLRQLNNLSNKDVIKPGQVIVVR